MDRTNVEIITVHYNTPDLLDKLYKSIREHLGYDILFRVIDGSEQEYYKFSDIEKQDSNFKFIRLGYNIHHGNGMNYAITTSTKDYILILDSDCVVLRSNLLDKMFDKLNPDETYAVGKIYKVQKCGLDTNSFDNFILYLHPKTMLLNKKKYFDYLPFCHHGAPCIKTMTDINDKGDFNVLINFINISDYVFEKGRGTVEKFGYGIKRAITQKIAFSAQKTMFNILVRTSGRPHYFKNCLNSILTQTYSNYKIIVSYDDDKTLSYLAGIEKLHLIRNQRIDITKSRPSQFDEFVGRKRLYSPYNLYFNKMKSLCDPNGFVIFLDDDDMFADSQALYKLYLHIKSQDDMLFWRVQFPTKLIPTDNVWAMPPQCCNIASCGFSFHMKHWEDWDGWTMGDFRVSKLVYNKTGNKIYINKILTKLQRKEANGLGKRDDI